MKIFSPALPKWMQIAFFVFVIGGMSYMIVWPWPFGKPFGQIQRITTKAIIVDKFEDTDFHCVVIRLDNRYYVIRVTEHFYKQHHERDSIPYEHPR